MFFYRREVQSLWRRGPPPPTFAAPMAKRQLLRLFPFPVRLIDQSAVGLLKKSHVQFFFPVE